MFLAKINRTYMVVWTLASRSADIEARIWVGLKPDDDICTLLKGAGYAPDSSMRLWVGAYKAILPHLEPVNQLAPGGKWAWHTCPFPGVAEHLLLLTSREN